MKTIFLDFVDRVERAVPVALLVCVPALCAGLASAERVPLPQNKPSTTAEDQNLRDQVIALVHQALRQGSGVTSEGVRYSTYLPPSAESIAVIQHLGERAIPVLSEFLWSEDDRESLVAMRFMGALGGSGIVKPLAEVVRRHPTAERRKLALRWLAEAPWNSVSSVLEEVAVHDPDPTVRKVAKDLILAHSK